MSVVHIVEVPQVLYSTLFASLYEQKARLENSRTLALEVAQLEGHDATHENVTFWDERIQQHGRLMRQLDDAKIVNRRDA